MRLAPLAWASFVAHALAAAASLFLLRPGTPVAADAASRAAYIATHLLEWRLGWASWTLASITLILLLATLSRRAGVLALVGFAFDLPSQVTLAIPLLEHERLAYIGAGVVANGIYTLALAWAVLRARLPRGMRWAALPVIAAGIATSVASFLLAPTLLFYATGALTVTMLAWTAALGVWAWPRRIR